MTASSEVLSVSLRLLLPSRKHYAMKTQPPKKPFRNSRGINSRGIFAINLVFSLALYLSWANGYAADLPPSRQRAAKHDSVRETAKVQFAGESFARVQAKRDRATKHPKLVQRLESRLIDAWQQAATEGV